MTAALVSSYIDVEVARRGDLSGLLDKLPTELPRLHERLAQGCAAAGVIPQACADLGVSPDMFDPLWRLMVELSCLPEDESPVKGPALPIIAGLVSTGSFQPIIERGLQKQSGSVAP